MPRQLSLKTIFAITSLVAVVFAPIAYLSSAHRFDALLVLMVIAAPILAETLLEFISRLLGLDMTPNRREKQ
jgi:hypothetical protein